MRDGNTQMVICNGDLGTGLNEGWPECGMETVAIPVANAITRS